MEDMKVKRTGMIELQVEYARKDLNYGALRQVSHRQYVNVPFRHSGVMTDGKAVRQFIQYSS